MDVDGENSVHRRVVTVFRGFRTVITSSASLTSFSDKVTMSFFFTALSVIAEYTAAC